MATPNLINVDTITPTIAIQAVTTSRVAIIDVTAEYCAKVNSLIISNIDGTNAASVNVLFYNGSTAFHICKLANVSAGDTLIVLGKDAPIYLKETEKIQCLGSATSDLEITVSYEEMDDA